jgi:uncharacterized membrane protein YbhN (UPF0104 family)
MRAGGSAVVGGLLGVVVGAIALGLALRDVDAAALAAAFARAGVAPIAVGAAMHVAVQALYALRWRVLLGRPDLPAARALGVVGLGYLANYTLPGRPGELVRAGLIRGLAGVPFALGLASLLLEKVLDGVTILGSALLYSLIGELPPLLRSSVLVGAGTFALAGALLVLVGIVPAGRLPLPGWARERLGEVGGPVRNLAGPRSLPLLLLLGVLIWLSILAHQGMLCLAVGIAPDPRAWLLLYAALGLASVVPGAPGYVGTYQLAAVLALGAFGVEREPAFAVATLYQVSRLLGSLLVGAWAASREGLTALRIYWASTPGRDEPSSHHASSSPASERSHRSA